MRHLPDILPVVILSLGTLLLSVLLLTVNASEHVARHPVYVTFLRTWWLWSCFVLYIDIAGLVTPAFKTDGNLIAFQSGLRDMLWTSTRISTLNLVIHTWATMKTWGCIGSARREKTRTLILVAIYIFCFVAVLDLVPIPTHNALDTKTVGLVIGYLCLALTIVTLLWDVVLIITFLRDRRILRQANIHGVMSIWMLIRLLVLCLYQLFMTITSGIFLAVPMMVPKRFSPALQSIHPLIVFVSMGLRRDILHAWFPCWIAGVERSRVIPELTIDLSVGVIGDAGGLHHSLAPSGEYEKTESVGSAIMRDGDKA